MAKPSNSDEKSQSDRFIETARELGCDESEERFEETFRKIVPPKRSPERIDKQKKEPGR